MLYGGPWIPNLFKLFLTFCFYLLVYLFNFFISFYILLIILIILVSFCRISFFHKKNPIKTKYFCEKKTTMVHEYHFWNLPHFFRNLAGNIYISFLLLLLKLRFTCAKENFSEWSKVPKYYDHGGRFRNGTHGPWNVFSNENISFDS